MSEKTVLLRIKGSHHSEPFEAAHAKRLLAFPNPQWEEVADQKPAEKKPAAAAATKKPAAPAPALPEVDTTGQPTSV
ncbi:MAG: hypothetical protein EOO62_39340 [Hymenobacter sp.]|nr:MAG: hypothetical protein EOO62_39340 [Hymenobacter sp.]